MATRILTGNRPPLPVALMHGGAGATGLGILTWAVLSSGSFGSPALALSVLGCNALLGFYLFSRHLRQKPWPKFAVVTHGFAAAIGFSMIVIFALTREDDAPPTLKFDAVPVAEVKAAPAEAVKVAITPTPAPEVKEVPTVAPPTQVPPAEVKVAKAPPAEVKVAPIVRPAPVSPIATTFTFPAEFMHNAVDFPDISSEELEQTKTWLNRCSGLIRAVGHTTPKGSDEGNYYVGLGRAMAVRQYLVGQGIKRRIRVQSAKDAQDGPVMHDRKVMLWCDSKS